MVEFEDEKPSASRIQWEDVDVEAAGPRPRPPLHRSDSNISIHSLHSRRGSIDPASALPIQYRTVSFQIAESKEKNAAEIQKAKDTAAKGISTSHFLGILRLTVI
jgi:sodium/potassium-transporting ATPase subunit alpha